MEDLRWILRVVCGGFEVDIEGGMWRVEVDIEGGMWRVEVDIEGDMWGVEVDIERGSRWILRVIC